MRNGMKYAVAAILAVSMVVTGCGGSSVKDSGRTVPETVRETVPETAGKMAPGRRQAMGQGTMWWLLWGQPQSRRPDLILPTDGGQANMSMSR
jgi:hypothetical protein